MSDYLKGQLGEEKEMNALLTSFGKKGGPAKQTRRAARPSKKK
jgi:hypothetical protein